MDDLQEIREQLAQAQRERDDLAERLIIQEQIIFAEQVRVSEARAEVEHLTNKFALDHNEKEQLRAEILEVGEEIREISHDCTAYAQEIVDLRVEVERLTLDVQMKAAYIDMQEGQMNEAARVIDKLRQQVEEAKEIIRGAVDNLFARIDENRAKAWLKDQEEQETR